MFIYVGGVACCAIEEFSFVGEVRINKFYGAGDAVRSSRTTGRVGPIKRHFTSKTEVIVG